MCDKTIQIHAYHDGELEPAQRGAFESHLASCADCQSALKELQGMSRLVSDAALPSAPADLSERIFVACDAARRLQDAGTRKLAGWLTAAAAVVLIVAMVRVSGLLNRTPENATIVDASTAGSRDWEFAAVMPPDRQAEDAGSAELIQLAQWMAIDLSPDERR